MQILNIHDVRHIVLVHFLWSTQLTPSLITSYPLRLHHRVTRDPDQSRTVELTEIRVCLIMPLNLIPGLDFPFHLMNKLCHRQLSGINYRDLLLANWKHLRGHLHREELPLRVQWSAVQAPQENRVKREIDLHRTVDGHQVCQFHRHRQAPLPPCVLLV